MNCKGFYLQLHVLHILEKELGTSPGPVRPVPSAQSPAQTPQLGNPCLFWREEEGPPISYYVSALSIYLGGYSITKVVCVTQKPPKTQRTHVVL